MHPIQTSLIAAALLLPTVAQASTNYSPRIEVDSDAVNDIAAGVTGIDGCGAVHLWVSGSGDLLLPSDDGRTSWFREPDIVLQPGSCDPGFGYTVVAATDDVLVVLGSSDRGYVFDRGLLATLSGTVDVDDVVSAASVAEINADLGLTLPDSSSQSCEPCSGPAPCCDGGCDPCSGPAPCCTDGPDPLDPGSKFTDPCMDCTMPL